MQWVQYCQKILILLVIYIFQENFYQISSVRSVDVSSLSSSIFCNSNKNNSKRCTFRNLLYNFHTNFVFLLTEKSIISGLNTKNDFKNIFATSVLNHSALPLKISIVYEKNFSKDVFMYERDVFFLHRFKPDNIMHVIHDDILPLYVTYRDLCFGNITHCVSKYDIMFTDQNHEETFVEWYKAFSKNGPFQLSKLNKTITYCFQRVDVGLSIDSIIYQYGFQQNRSSTPLSIHQAILFKQFRTFMLDHFATTSHNSTYNVVLIGRKLNRKILNEDYVEDVIYKTFKNELNISVNITNMDLSRNNSKELLQSVSKANYLIGMHGAGMFLSIFLPENSVVIELFPYGIQKELVSPLFVMSSIPGIWFKYFSWENNNHLNSFPHPEYISLFGGLIGISREEQVSIFKNKLTNPSLVCCNDPLFLSRMYQDTLIDDNFKDTVSLALRSQKHEGYKKSDLGQLSMNEWFFPSVVRDISCSRKNGDVILNWNHPFNINSTKVTYDIAVQTPNQNISVVARNLSVILKLDSEMGFINIWIKCILLGVEGEDTFITC